MGDGRPSSSYNVSEIMVFQPYSFKVKYIHTLRGGRSVEGDGYIIRKGVWEGFTNG